MDTEAYKLRLSDCIVPVKGLVDYIIRVNKADKEQGLMADGAWKDISRFYILGASQSVVIGLPIIVATNLEFLLNQF